MRCMSRTTQQAVARLHGGSSAASPPSIWKRRGLWLAATASCFWLMLSLGSFNSADWPSSVVATHAEPPANLGGRIGAVVAWFTYESMGFGVWIPLLCAAYALVAVFMGRSVSQIWIRSFGALIMMVGFGALHATWFPKLGPFAGAESGLVPQWCANQLLWRFSTVTTSLILLSSLGVGALLAIDELVFALPNALARAFEHAKPIFAYDYGAAFARLRNWHGAPRPTQTALVGGDTTAQDYEGVSEARPSEPRPVEKVLRPRIVEDEPLPSPAEPAPLTTADLRERIAKLPVRLSGSNPQVARDEDIPREDSFEGYQFPSIDLLDDPETNFSARIENYVREQAGILTESLRQYQLDGEVVGIESGPVVTLYSVEMAPGTRVARLESIAKDIARALQAPNIRIIPNMVGRTAVGIEVPNRQKEKVRLKELMSSGHAEGMVLPMFLGKDSAGEPLVVDLTKMPHMLIAGTTGSGKSVCMNSIVMSWLYTKRPDELKLVLVDPKMVEMSQFSEIPHLMSPVVTDMGKAAAILEWAVGKMEERYEIFNRAGVQNIALYNALGEAELFERLNPQSDAEKARIPKKLPYMVFVIDELADLMMTNKEVEHSIVRIAQKARATGIHLILATQRPQANVVTGLIKSNMPCRISYKVASSMDSRIVLDQKGAELLLGQGDMMVLTPSSSDLRRAQGTLVTDQEIRRVVRFLKDVASPNFERALVSIRSEADSEAGVDGLDGPTSATRDPLFDKAVEVVLEDGRGSVSLLQRRMAIGYGRASRIIDLMGLAGIVSNHRGSVARDVLISPEDWQRMKSMRDGSGEGDAEASGADTANTSTSVSASTD